MTTLCHIKAAAAGVALLFAVAFAALGQERETGTLVVTLPVATAPVEVEVLRFADGEGGKVVARIAAPGRLELEADVFALRLAGTDHRHGPVQVIPDSTTNVRLAAIEMRKPRGTISATHFVLDATGALAARLADVASPQPVLPGDYLLQRDESDIGMPIALAPGETVRLDLAGLALAEPGPVASGRLFLRSADGTQTAAILDYPGQPISMMPGRYVAVLEQSSLGVPVELEPGAVTLMHSARILARSLAGTVPYAAIGADSRRIVLLAETGEVPRLIFDPGEPIAILPDPTADNATERLATAWQGALPDGGTMNVWVAADGRASGPEGALQVQIDDGATDVVVDKAFTARVPLTEASTLAARLVLVTDDRGLHEISGIAAEPPLGVIDFPPGKLDVEDGTPIRVEVQAVSGDGTELGGWSPVYVARRVTAEPPSALSAAAESPTRIAIGWEPGAGAAGYNLYRVPGNGLPVNGSAVIDGAGYVDRILTAGRSYRYRVCVVDHRGFEGRCTPAIEVATPPGGFRGD